MAKPLKFTPKEKGAILDLLRGLRRREILAFMRDNELAGRSGNKDELLGAVAEAIADGETSYLDVLAYVDGVAPWGKQHVYLLDGPAPLGKRWAKHSWVETLLGKHRRKTLLKRGKRLVLPPKLTLAHVAHTPQRVTITAVRRRMQYDRLPSKDYDDTDNRGRKIAFRAYHKQTKRLIVRLEWDLVTGAAMLQITQLQSGKRYEAVRDEFSKLLDPWLDLSVFTTIDLHKAIKALQRRSRRGDEEVIINVADYVDGLGNSLRASSSQAAASLPKTGWLNRAMGLAVDQGTGRHGNIYWSAQDRYANNGRNPLKREVHVHLLAKHNRVNITRPHNEPVVRYVLERIRQACR